MRLMLLAAALLLGLLSPRARAEDAPGTFTADRFRAM